MKKINYATIWNSGGQTGDHTWKVSRQRTKSTCIGNPRGRKRWVLRHGTKCLFPLRAFPWRQLNYRFLCTEFQIANTVANISWDNFDRRPCKTARRQMLKILCLYCILYLFTCTVIRARAVRTSLGKKLDNY